MTTPPSDISQAIDFAKRAVYHHFDDGRNGAPNLMQCRFCMFIALKGHLGRGQIRVAQVKNAVPGRDEMVYLDENTVFCVDDNLFDERGLVSEKELFTRANAFSQEPVGENTRLILQSPTAGMLQEHVKPEYVAAYRKFLGLAFQDIELRRQTPQVETSPPRHRL